MLCEPTHPPTTHHLPGCFWEVPGVFGKFRVFLGSSGCFWEVPRVCLESSGCFWEVPRVFWEVPARFRKFPGVLEGCRVLGPKKHVLRSFVCEKNRSKAKTRNFRPMFHAEPAGIRSWSSEPEAGDLKFKNVYPYRRFGNSKNLETPRMNIFMTDPYSSMDCSTK